MLRVDTYHPWEDNSCRVLASYWDPLALDLHTWDDERTDFRREDPFAVEEHNLQDPLVEAASYQQGNSFQADHRTAFVACADSVETVVAAAGEKEARQRLRTLMRRRHRQTWEELVNRHHPQIQQLMVAAIQELTQPAVIQELTEVAAYAVAAA